MEYTTLGKTGRQVSRLGFGGAPAGLKDYLQKYNPESDRDGVIAAIKRGLELGITYFDTAAGYGEGASERIFGQALAGAGAEGIFLATKVGLWGDVDLRRSLEASLRNLRRDSVDLLQFHGTAWTEEEARAILCSGGYLDQMGKLRDEGLIRHTGFTVEVPNAATFAMLKTGRFDVVQVMYNLLFQHPYEPTRKSGLLYDAEQRGAGIVTMRTATSGMFQRWLQCVRPEDAFDYTPALIQFVLSNPLVDVALVGMRSAAEVEANVRTCEDQSGRVDLDRLFGRYV